MQTFPLIPSFAFQKICRKTDNRAKAFQNMTRVHQVVVFLAFKTKGTLAITVRIIQLAFRRFRGRSEADCDSDSDEEI